MTNSNIQSLNAIGQSIWYDNLSKDVLESGELAKLIEGGVSGLTSNPTIFQKAISGSNKYDQAISALLPVTKEVERVTEDLMVRDVAAAADLLLPTYKATQAADGYASIEVSPLLAADTLATLSAARNLWSQLRRPNIMIKIPATPEGIPAIKAALTEGINVNVTLIFSEAVYRQVAEAYITALEERVASGLPVEKIASVASFFVSRVDAICEKELEKLQVSAEVAKQLLGQVGIANSLVAYQAYEELFVTSDRFKKLKAKSAQVQRPLWASTGTKNPNFDPLLYVKALVLSNTVNTLPPATLDQLIAAESFDPQPATLNSALSHLETLKSCGVNLNALLKELQVQGVKLFADSFTELLNATQEKIARLS